MSNTERLLKIIARTLILLVKIQLLGNTPSMYDQAERLERELR